MHTWVNLSFPCEFKPKSFMFSIVSSPHSPSETESRCDSGERSETCDGLPHVVQQHSCALGPRRVAESDCEPLEDSNAVPLINGLHLHPQLELWFSERFANHKDVLSAHMTIDDAEPRSSSEVPNCRHQDLFARGCDST